MATSNLNIMHFIIFLALSRCHCVANYHFEEETIKYFAYAIGDNISQQTLERHPLYKLNYDKQRELCGAARGPESMLPTTSGIKQEVNKFAIYFLNGTYEVHIALICATLPRVLLCLADESGNKIKVMVEKIQYLDQRYEFEIEIVKSIKAQATQSDASKKKLREHYLSSLRNRDRWEICIAAKRCFQRDVILDIIFSNNWYEIIKLYDIVYPNGRKIKDVVAFLCSTIPETYLRPEPENSRKQFMIMIVPAKKDRRLLN